jgi:hypothetical protein
MDEYTQLWNAWAVGEKPRRKTISLYGELFAIKHAVEAEETAKPVQLVWGIGIATWTIDFRGSSVAFEYPLLTQALEILLDEKSLALQVRPCATNTRPEMDALAASSITKQVDSKTSTIPSQ